MFKLEDAADDDRAAARSTRHDRRRAHRENDLEINILKGKQLTNIRTTSKDEAVRLTPPIRMTLEKALAYIETTSWSRSPEVDPAAQEVPRRQRAQARGKVQGSGGVRPTSYLARFNAVMPRESGASSNRRRRR